MIVDFEFKPGDICYFIYDNAICKSHVIEVYFESHLTNLSDVVSTGKFKTFCEANREIWLNPGDIFHNVEGVLEKLRSNVQCNSLR